MRRSHGDGYFSGATAAAASSVNPLGGGTSMTSTTEGPTARAAAFLGGIGELLVAGAARQRDGSTDRARYLRAFTRESKYPHRLREELVLGA